MKLGPGLSFSWKRALGVTKAKRRVSKKTGIPIKRITGGRYTGVAATWQRTTLPKSMAFVVELGKTLNVDEAKVHAEAVLNIASLLRDAVPRKLEK